MSYFEDLTHCKIHQSHYVEKTYRGCYALLFTEDWKNRFLPLGSTPSSDPNSFDVLLKDTTDGKTYKTKMYVAYEDPRSEFVYDDCYEFIEIELCSLMGYFYGDHHCACHRKQDAKEAGAIVEDDECEGNRFVIESIACPKMPDLILYSETLSEDELENTLIDKFKVVS